MCLGEERLGIRYIWKCWWWQIQKNKMMKGVICVSEGKFAYGVCLNVRFLLELKKLVDLMTDLEKVWLMVGYYWQRSTRWRTCCVVGGCCTALMLGRPLKIWENEEWYTMWIYLSVTWMWDCRNIDKEELAEHHNEAMDVEETMGAGDAEEERTGAEYQQWWLRTELSDSGRDRPTGQCRKRESYVQLFF